MFAHKPDKNIYILSTSRVLSSYWSVLDQISSGTAHLSIEDQSSSDICVLGGVFRGRLRPQPALCYKNRV